jgi:hypothetical protein
MFRRLLKMGNTPSTSDLRDGNRLSKPKLQSSGSMPVIISSPQQLKPELARSQTDIYQSLPNETEVLEELRTGELRTRPEVRHQIRSQILGDEKAIEETEDASEAEDKFSPLRPSPSYDRMSQSISPRASQSILTGPSQSSLAVDPRNVDLQTAVSILEELRKTATPEDLIALRKSQMNIGCGLVLI